MPRKHILFFAKAPMNVVMFRPLVEHLRDDPRLALHYCGEPAAGLTVEAMYAAGGLPGVSLTPLWWARIRRYDAYISPDKAILGKRARCKIQIYHGVSFKGRMYDQQVMKYDKLFMIGEDMRRRYIERGILAPGDSRIERIGMPKTDRLCDGTLNREALLRQLDLDPARKTVIFAPTWRTQTSLYEMGDQIMGDLPARLGINLLIKLHDLALDAKDNPVDWRKELPRYERGSARVIRDADIVPWLLASDALISDASSVANEYLLLDRPIVFVDVPKLLKHYEKTIDLGGWGRTTGEVVASYEELAEAVKHALEAPEEKSAIRREAAKDFFYNPGGATQAAIEAIYRCLKIQGP